MECPEEFSPTMTCKGLGSGPPLLVNGTVWTPEPEEPESEGPESELESEFRDPD